MWKFAAVASRQNGGVPANLFFDEVKLSRSIPQPGDVPALPDQRRGFIINTQRLFSKLGQ
jgi:hypothetical protein